jgi:hypothetical protein
VNGDGSDQLQISRLKESSVVCQASTCEEPAEFVVKDSAGVIRALCRQHLKALGIADKDIPPEN